MNRRSSILRSGLILFLLICLAPLVRAWEREPNERLCRAARQTDRRGQRACRAVRLYGPRRSESFLRLHAGRKFLLPHRPQRGRRGAAVASPNRRRRRAGPARAKFCISRRAIRQRKNGRARAWARTIPASRRKPALPMSRRLRSCTIHSPRSRKTSPKSTPNCPARTRMAIRTRRTGPNG